MFTIFLHHLPYLLFLVARTQTQHMLLHFPSITAAIGHLQTTLTVLLSFLLSKQDRLQMSVTEILS